MGRGDRLSRDPLWSQSGRGLSPWPPYVTAEGLAARSHRTGGRCTTALPASSHRALILLLPAGHRERAALTEGWRPCSRKSWACCIPAGIFQGKGEGPATMVCASCSPGPPSSQEAYPSGGDPGAGSSCRRLRVPLPRPVRKAGRETLRLPSSWWVPSPVHRRGSGEPSPSSPEPKKSNSLMASSESSSSSSSSISGTRALEGS